MRLKSSRLLRSYRKQPPTRVQCCSRCKQVGHNAKSKACPALIPVEAEHEEGGMLLSVDEPVAGGADPVNEGGPEEVDEAWSENVIGTEETFQLDTVEDLLGDSDNDTY